MRIRFRNGVLVAVLFVLGCSSGKDREKKGPTGEETSVAKAPAHQIRLRECYFPLERTYRDDELVTVLSFQVREDRRPSDLKVLLNHAEIPEARLQKCLAGWTFGRIPAGTRVSVAFRWEGAAGWRYVRLSAEAVGYLEEIPM